MAASKWPIYRPWRQKFAKVAIIAVGPLPFWGRPDGARGAHCYNRYCCKLLQPWPIDSCLKVAHLSAMAANVCKSSDYSSALLAVLGQAQIGMPMCMIKHVTFDTFDVKSSIVLVFPAKKRQTAREATQNTSANAGILQPAQGGASGFGKNLQNPLLKT